MFRGAVVGSILLLRGGRAIRALLPAPRVLSEWFGFRSSENRTENTQCLRVPQDEGLVLQGTQVSSQCITVSPETPSRSTPSPKDMQGQGPGTPRVSAAIQGAGRGQSGNQLCTMR